MVSASCVAQSAMRDMLVALFSTFRVRSGLSGSASGTPAICEAKPIVVHSGTNRTPERPERRDCSIAGNPVPIDETAPIPVTTTRRSEAIRPSAARGRGGHDTDRKRARGSKLDSLGGRY